MTQLPDADELFLRYLDPWYTDGLREMRSHKATRPDMLQDKAMAGRDPANLSREQRASTLSLAGLIRKYCGDAQAHWPKFMPVSGDIDLSWIAAFDLHFDRDELAALIELSPAYKGENEYLRVLTEFGAVLGHVLCSTTPPLVWWTGSPIWEAALLHAEKGILIPPFHWAVKKMSGTGVDDGLVEKIEACMGHVTGRD